MSSNLLKRLSEVRQLASSFYQRSNQVLAGSLVAGLAAVGLGSFQMVNAAAEVPPSLSPSTEALPDGVYLYGQSAQPDQIGKGYFVFEAKRGKVIGALYMPSSSFDCTLGQFEQSQLALTVVNSYDRTTNPFEIALERDYNVAAGSNSSKPVVSLDGFHRLKVVSQNDLRMLETCKADLNTPASP